MPIDASVIVRHVTKDHVVIVPGPGYSVTLFHLANNVEAIASNGEETIRLLVAGPGPDQTMTIRTDDLGIVHIEYTETRSEV